MTDKRARLALITGAAHGLGRCLAGEAAASGHDLILADRDTLALASVAEDLAGRHGCGVQVFHGDLSERKANHALSAKALEGRAPDIVVLNAGVGWEGDFLAMPADRRRAMIGLHMTGPTEMIALLAPAMARSDGGRFLIVASIAALMPGPRMALYHATKSYLLMLGRSLAEEWHRRPLTVTVLCPGLLRTRFFRLAGMDDDRRLFHNPLLPPMTPEAAARAGWRAMMRGQRECVPGLRYRLTMGLTRLLPQRMQASGVRNLHRTPRSRRARP